MFLNLFKRKPKKPNIQTTIKKMFGIDFVCLRFAELNLAMYQDSLDAEKAKNLAYFFDPFYLCQTSFWYDDVHDYKTRILFAQLTNKIKEQNFIDEYQLDTILKIDACYQQYKKSKDNHKILKQAEQIMLEHNKFSTLSGDY